MIAAYIVTGISLLGALWACRDANRYARRAEAAARRAEQAARAKHDPTTPEA